MGKVVHQQGLFVSLIRHGKSNMIIDSLVSLVVLDKSVSWLSKCSRQAKYCCGYADLCSML